MEDDGKKGMFVIFENDQRAGEMTFTWAGDSKFIIDHTGVDSSYEGKGYGRILVKAAVDYARNKPAKIIPLCPFAKRQFEKHPEYSDVLLF
ncbi:MAG: GNAT family N-acetyltransferase [Bacteroidales bacterium]|nr:GNAT family N-acetyltransferase [Bacteroidales bacterium]